MRVKTEKSVMRELLKDPNVAASIRRKEIYWDRVNGGLKNRSKSIINWLKFMVTDDIRRQLLKKTLPELMALKTSLNLP
jgi:hypothetical protein